MSSFPFHIHFLLLCYKLSPNLEAYSNKHLLPVVSVGQEPESSLDGWLWLSVSPEVIIRLLAALVVNRRLAWGKIHV